jgi:hypothetical protein
VRDAVAVVAVMLLIMIVEAVVIMLMLPLIHLFFNRVADNRDGSSCD